MHNGLVSDSGDASKLKMLITYVDNLPTGYSHFFFVFGKYLCKISLCAFHLIDLFGLNFMWASVVRVYIHYSCCTSHLFHLLVELYVGVFLLLG